MILLFIFTWYYGSKYFWGQDGFRRHEELMQNIKDVLRKLLWAFLKSA